jgi:sterol 14alpha-demethylase
MSEYQSISTPPVVSGARPVFGHLLEFLKDRPGLVKRGYDEHGPVFTIRLMSQNVALLIGPEHHRLFFMETDKALNISTPYKFLRATFGEVFFIAGHEEYLRQRPVVQQAFRREKMAHYTTVMQREVQRWLDGLGDEGEFEIAGEMAHVAQQVAGYALMGEKFQEDAGDEFWELYGDLSRSLDPVLPPNLPLPKFFRRDRARARMGEIIQPILDDRRAHPENYNDFLQDFVNSHYADGQPIEDEVLLNLMLGLMFAGHETTAGQAAWNIILLLQHPDYLARVQEEIDRVLPYGTPIDLKTIHALTYLGYAITETERLRPSAPMLIRDVDEAVEAGGYVIPAGWKVQVAQEVAHTLPQYFDEPERYDPLRFAPGREEDKADRFSLIGFGGGVHKCTGMNFANNEQVVIAALLLQQLDLELVTKNPEIERGMGANKPKLTYIRYRRKQIPATQIASVASSTTNGCPFHETSEGGEPAALAHSRMDKLTSG